MKAPAVQATNGLLIILQPVHQILQLWTDKTLILAKKSFYFHYSLGKEFIGSYLINGLRIIVQENKWYAIFSY